MSNTANLDTAHTLWWMCVGACGVLLICGGVADSSCWWGTDEDMSADEDCAELLRRCAARVASAVWFIYYGLALIGIAAWKLRFIPDPFDAKLAASKLADRVPLVDVESGQGTETLYTVA